MPLRQALWRMSSSRSPRTTWFPAIEVAISRYEQIRALEKEVGTIRDQFETRKLVDRAKSLLITKMNLTEPEAFRWIQKTSMDRRLSMREVSDTIIKQLSQIRDAHSTYRYRYERTLRRRLGIRPVCAFSWSESDQHLFMTH